MAARIPAIDASPPVHRATGPALDRSVFRKSIPVLAARVPASATGKLLRAPELKRAVLDLPKLRTVIPDPSGSSAERLLLLKVSNEADLTTETRDFLHAHQAELTTHTIELDYDYWTADEIFHAVLPEEVLDGAPNGFAATGHLAHMNLESKYLPFKFLIGQVILDKNKKIRTVVNKLDSIDNQFRFFKMELIAGEPDYIVEHHESDCTFTFDFTQVYWNSRLHSEHERLVQLFKPEDVVADVFAGVGPFALPAAKKGCAVWANDLNPNSFKYLKVNIENNKVSDLVKASCEDGRAFIRSVVERAYDDPFPAYTGPPQSRARQRLEARRQREQGTTRVPSPAPEPPSPARSRRAISHFVMNLPDSAITFLNAFRGVFAAPSDEARDLSGIYRAVMPMVHCHCFTRELELPKAEEDIRTRVEEQLGHPLGKDVALHLVRSVAPNKDMYCISFRLPAEVAFAA